MFFYPVIKNRNQQKGGSSTGKTSESGQMGVKPSLKQNKEETTEPGEPLKSRQVMRDE